MGYSLGDVLKEQLKGPGGDVSNLDTSGREQIEYISLDKISGDLRNFYSLSGLEELAASIELVGLQQPLRVRENPETEGRFIIVSGHRRRAALQKLVDEGRTDLREVPCIREAPAASAALQELRLIYANSGTRVLSSAELSLQAERVEELLYRLKEEGMEFPGRMRDHVAEACRVSKSKLARLKVIREKLIPEAARQYRDGRLKEAPAYELARQPAGVQRLVWKYSDAGRRGALTEWQIANILEKIKPVLERSCRLRAGGPPCGHQPVLLEKMFNRENAYSPCGRVCCDQCEKLASCKSACPLLEKKVKKLRADRTAQNRQEKLARQERDRPEVEAISAFWEREAAARTAAGKSVRELFKATETYYSDENEKEWLERESLQNIKRGGILPFGMYGFSLSEARKLVATADFLGVTTDYLLGRTEAPGGADGEAPAWRRTAPPEEAAGQLVICGWMPGGTFPREPCDVVADFQAGGRVFRKACCFDGKVFLMGKSGAKIDAECVRWMALPPVDGDVSKLDTNGGDKEGSGGGWSA